MFLSDFRSSRGGTALGALLMGILGEWLGIQWPVVIGGILLLLLCAWIMSRRKFLEESLERAPAEDSFTGKPGFK